MRYSISYADNFFSQKKIDFVFDTRQLKSIDQMKNRQTEDEYKNNVEQTGKSEMCVI